MRVAVVGGTGFVGHHLCLHLQQGGHEVVATGRSKNRRWEQLEEQGIELVEASLSDIPILTEAFEGCDAVVNCVGIHRERGEQTFDKIHIRGTGSLISALRRSEVQRIVLLSYLRARNFLDSPYHTTKWHSEEMLRKSGLQYTIFKPGVIYGDGDGFLTNMKRTLRNFPFFGLVGLRPQVMAPLHVDDLCRALVKSLSGEDSVGKTYAMVGPEECSFREVVKRVAESADIAPTIFPMPSLLHRIAALIMERTMDNPFLSSAQVTMMTESMLEPAPGCDPLPEDLTPTTPFTL